VEVPRAEATGYGCTEAPRGILYHRYTLDARCRSAASVAMASQAKVSYPERTMKTQFQMLAHAMPGGENLWREDPVLRHVVRRLLPDPTWQWAEPMLDAMGAVVPARVDRLAALADRHGPTLRSHDRFGERIDEVEYHPAYRELEEIAYGSGMVALKYDPEVRAAHGGSIHTVGFALGILFSQAESGLYCPLCMTDGAARLIERHASETLRNLYLPRLASRDARTLYTGAMFLTEKQGGSDVGANATRAVRAEAPGFGDLWKLYGEKWFCSNVDAQVAMVLARPEGAPAGTRGLGLFLLPRPLPDGSRNHGVVIERLKDKLGVRSMATGEVRLDGALAFQVGEVDQGFRIMTQMVNLSRLYNAVASAAVLRRAVFEAARWAKVRTAFGKPIASHPLCAATLADLWAEAHGATALVFAAVSALDRLDARGAESDARLSRILIPLAKGYLGKVGVAGISEAMEVVGGNGYIEEWPLPRMLRDAQVLPIWEGTTNIQVLDAFRAMAKESAHQDLFEAVRAWLSVGRAQGELAAGDAEAALRELAEAVPVLADAGEGAQHLWRRWFDRCAQACEVAALLREAASPQPIPDGPRAVRMLAAAAERLARRHLRGARLVLEGLGGPPAEEDLLS
jgi:alkylation response protein AidB-like acyl-CoA dehydrogenase